MRRFNGHDPGLQQLRWRSDAVPVATVRPGELFEVDVPDSSSGQLSLSSDRRALERLDLDRVDAAVGPFAVEGAVPGDAVVVHLEGVDTADWGWSGVFRDFGLLRGRFDDDLVLWRRDGAAMVPVSGPLRPVPIPQRPMVGWLGVAPSSGDLGMIAPQVHGGNLDNRLHAPGASITLPVQRDGALLLVGDVHAAQGDGEVCGTGIEVPARLRLRVELRPRGAPRTVRARSPGLPAASGPYVVTEGVGADPRAAATTAVEEMIRVFGEHGVDEVEAYLLLSLAGDLRLSEVVDEPHWVVSMLFEEALLERTAATPRRPSR